MTIAKHIIHKKSYQRITRMQFSTIHFILAAITRTMIMSVVLWRKCTIVQKLFQTKATAMSTHKTSHMLLQNVQQIQMATNTKIEIARIFAVLFSWF